VSLCGWGKIGYCINVQLGGGPVKRRLWEICGGDRIASRSRDFVPYRPDSIYL